jgi:hypothetical protein
VGDIIRFPYSVPSRQWVEKLIKAGYLRNRDRYDAQAVENAANRLRERTKEFFERDDNAPDPPPNLA